MYIYLFLFTLVFTVKCDTYTYQTEYITVPVDHFSFANNATFKLRYLINDTFWKIDGPIFFYTGNEGDITVFAQNTGFLWEIAPTYNAVVVFAEHRYYGKTLPFGSKSFSNPTYLGYLTSSQALEDYVYLIDSLQKQFEVKNKGRRCPVIAFGGSYGGMLAAWIRLKFPGSVDAALASSAPIYQFTGLTKCNAFNEILANVFQVTCESNAVQNMKNSWKTIRNISSTDDGKSWLSSTWKLCTPLKTSNDVENLIGWINDVYGNLGMVNYPYETNFLSPLPAYPVKEFCKKISVSNVTDKALLKTLINGLSVYTNYTGKTKCLNYNETSANVDENAWNFQACTELVMPMCSENNDIFENSSWNFTTFSQDCFKKFGVRVDRDDLAILEYGGRNALYTNIIFTNGLLDPWSPGGFLQSSTSAYAIVIPNAAHHLDLRASNANDPITVVNARSQIKYILNAWMTTFNN